MESNNAPASVIESVWTPVSDVNDHILSFFSTFDLLKCARTCKGFRQYFESKGWLKHLEKLFSKYDLEYLPENIPWIQLVERYDKIDRSIRNGCAVVNCIATPVEPENDVQDRIDAVSSNDEYIALNWTVTEGFGSGAYDVIARSAVVDLRHRNPIKTAQGPNALRILGDVFGEQGFSNPGPWGDLFTYEDPIELMRIKDEGHETLHSLRARPKTRGIVANRDPSMKHLIAIVAPIIKSDSLLDRSDLEIVIFDTKALKEVTKVLLVDASEPQMYTKPMSVVFKGKKIYYSENIHPVAETTLHIVDWTKNNEHKKFTLPGTWSDIYGVHKSLVYGTTAADWNDRSIFVYDVNTGRYLQRKKTVHYCRSTFEVLCGYLVYTEDSMIYFLDYRGDKLEVVSSFVVSSEHRTCNYVRAGLDGTLLLSTVNGSVKRMDFENTCDMIEVMQMTGVNGETEKFSFPAHELGEKIAAILGDDFVSRYYRVKEDYRCGIFYRRVQTGPQLPLSQKYLRHKAQYNTPYQYYKRGTGFQQFHINQEYPKYTETGLYGTVVFFYEKWDGQRFKLAKPRDWNKLLK